jgi:hypoxanthine phosphoribosyltransferase
LGYLVQNLESRCPASVAVCALLSNPDQQLIRIPIAYSGFDVSDEWLMGYGLDMNERGVTCRTLCRSIKASVKQ